MRARFQAAAVAMVACGLVAGCSDTRFETPDATFQTAKVAFADNDYSEFCDCLSEDSRDEMAASMVFMGGFMQIDTKSEEATDVAAVFKKHGLDKESNPKVTINVTAGKKDQKDQFKKLVEPIKDRNAFIVDMIAVFRKHKPDAKPFESDAKLTDLKIDGQVATATVEQTRDGKKHTTPIKFAKNGNHWKIDEFAL